jgi:hypothetical protein
MVKCGVNSKTGDRHYQSWPNERRKCGPYKIRKGEIRKEVWKADGGRTEIK